MADPYHHSLSSVKRWGGSVEDYAPIHEWFDATKAHFCDPRHRAMRHHAEGIDAMIALFGRTITTSAGRVVPTRWIGEQHVTEDFGYVPTMQDFLVHMTIEPWMVKGSRKLSADPSIIRTEKEVLA